MTTPKTETTPDWAELQAAELLPCLHTHPVWCVPGGEHGVKCPAHRQKVVAQALRQARSAALEAAAALVEGFPVINADARRTAEQIRTLKEQE